MNSMRRKLPALAGVAYLFQAVLLQPAAAHHSAAEYDFDKTVEVEGTLVELKWQNPHILFKVRSGADTQAGSIWDFEGGSVSIMRRTNATRESLRVGDKVRVAGNPSRRGPNRVFATNLLQADGTELVFFPDIRPRWRSAAAGSVGTWFDPGTAANASSGIFRVWSSKLDDLQPFFRATYPVTEAARARLAAWDPVNSEVVAEDCEPMGMPIIMDNLYPLEFVRQKDAVLLRMEIYDTVRTIHMSDGVALSSLPPSLVGRSIGRWEGATLVVKTDGITWRHLDHHGMPLSPAASLVERFTPSADGALLNYSIVITDPQFLTQPIELKRSWVARPNESVKPFNCGRSP
jgi:hypothetical protein